MQASIPSVKTIMTNLLRADFTTQWRNRRAVIMVILVPVIILISWKGLIDKFGGAFALSNCITMGLTAIGLMGYSNSIARDRDKSIFQRLRVAPIPSWSVMVSRLCVQLAMILIMTSAVFLAGAEYDKINLSVPGYLLGFVMALIGGAVYLGLGQMVVGLIKNPETVNSTCRLVYFVFIMVGMFGELGVLGDNIGNAVKWSPYGTVKHIISAAVQNHPWAHGDYIAMLMTIGYAIVFSAIGIKCFRWETR